MFYRENVDLPFVRSEKSFSACRNGQNRIYYQSFSWGVSICRQFLGNQNLYILFCKAALWRQSPNSPRRPTPSGLLKVIILPGPPSLSTAQDHLPRKKYVVIFSKVIRKENWTKPRPLHFTGHFLTQTPSNPTKPATCSYQWPPCCQVHARFLSPHQGHLEAAGAILHHPSLHWASRPLLSPWFSLYLTGPIFSGFFADDSSAFQTLNSIIPQDFRAFLFLPAISRKSHSMPRVFCGL